MALDRFEVRVSITKLLLGLIIVIVPLSIVGLILTERSDKALDKSIGTDFKTVAEMYGNEVSQFIPDRILDLKTIAADPAIIDAVSSPHKGANKSTATTAPNTQTNRSANAGEGTTEKGMLASAASDALRHRRELDPRFLSLIVTDENGTVVAASQTPPKPSYAQDELWQAAYNKGQGAVKVSNIMFEDVTKAYYVNIAVPITDPASSALLGELRAAVNVNTVLARFKQDQIGNGARAELVDDDGTIVSAPNADVFARVKSADFDGVRDSLGSLQGQQTGWVMPTLRTGPRIIGFAATGLKQHYENLGWVVLVSQDEHQAAAPMRAVERFAIVMVILGLLMVTLLFVYYYLHRTQRFADIEEVLPSDRDRAAAASS